MKMSQSYKNVVKATSYAKAYQFSDARDLTGYTLRIQLRDKLTSAVVNSIDRMITDTQENNTQFYVFLSATDLDIPEGDYVLGAEVANVSTGEAKETTENLRIVKEWVY